VQRQTASSLFHFNNLQSFVPTFQERAEKLSVVLEKAAESGECVEMQDQFMRFTMDSIGELGFGVKVGAIEGNKKALDFCEAFDYTQEESAHRFSNPFWSLFSHRIYYEKLKVLNGFMQDIINERKEEIASGVDVSGRVDLLSKFISAKDEKGNASFNDQYLLDVLKNFLIAGRDTTAGSLTWAIYLISEHPDVERKLLDEIERVVGKDGQITYENLAELKYMRQVIDEVLRLYPSVPTDSRFTTEEVVLPGSGYKIPANTTVGYSAYAQHRLPEYFKDPETFNPDRWVTDSVKAFAFVPFHGGPRICLGQNMAYQEMKVALAILLPRFTFKLKKRI